MIPQRYSGKKLIGRLCRPTREIRNGAGQGVSPGTVCIIRDVVRGHGITIQANTCPCCGQYAYITRVPRTDLELIDRRVRHAENETSAPAP